MKSQINIEAECLIKMILVWGYLSENPKKHKVDAYIYLGLDPDLNDCPCCEYCASAEYDPADEDWDNESRECEKCPLAKHWPVLAKDLSRYPVHYPCTMKGSSFLEWYNSEYSKIRQSAARSIMYAAFKALHELHVSLEDEGINENIMEQSRETIDHD